MTGSPFSDLGLDERAKARCQWHWQPLSTCRTDAEAGGGPSLGLGGGTHRLAWHVRVYLNSHRSTLATSGRRKPQAPGSSPSSSHATQASSLPLLVSVHRLPVGCGICSASSAPSYFFFPKKKFFFSAFCSASCSFDSASRSAADVRSCSSPAAPSRASRSAMISDLRMSVSCSVIKPVMPGADPNEGVLQRCNELST